MLALHLHLHLHCPWRIPLSPPLLRPTPFHPKKNRPFPHRSLPITNNNNNRRVNRVIRCGLLPLVDPWAPNIDSQSIASQLFAVSLFPYLGFLYFLTKSNTAPKLTLFGFYFLLAFVGATIPAGIYAKLHYGTSLSNVDWLHGGAESLLTITNLLIVLGLREALRKLKVKSTPDPIASDAKEKKSLSR